MFTIDKLSDDVVTLTGPAPSSITIYDGDSIEYATELKAELDAAIDDRIKLKLLLSNEGLPPHWVFKVMTDLTPVHWECDYCSQDISSSTEPFMCRCGCTEIKQKPAK